VIDVFRCSLLLALDSLAEESYQVKETRRSQRQIRNQLLEKTQLQLQRNAELSRYWKLHDMSCLTSRTFEGFRERTEYVPQL